MISFWLLSTSCQLIAAMGINPNTPDNSNIMAWNANGIKHQMYELQECVLLHQPAIVIVSEIKLSANERAAYNIRGYNKIRQDRPNQKGGGILIYRVSQSSMS